MFRLRSSLLAVVIGIVLALGPLVTTHAAMVDTQDLLPLDHTTQDMSETRKVIEQQLVDLGVLPQQAQQRIAQLNDDQVRQISQKLNELPAGAGAGSILLTLFIVFVITDVIGATDIFTFIRPIR